MDAAHAAGRYVYQNTNDATVYTGPTVGTDSLMFFKPNCKGMIGVKLRMYASGSHYGRIVLMGTPEGAMAGHGDRYLSQGGYKFIGCDFDNNARSNNWLPNIWTWHHISKFQLEQQACFKIDSRHQGRFTMLFDSCDFRDSCGDAHQRLQLCQHELAKLSILWLLPWPSRAWVHRPDRFQYPKPTKVITDNSFGQFWGCGFQDIEVDGPGDNLIARFYDVWADGDFDEQSDGAHSGSQYYNSHTTGGGHDVISYGIKSAPISNWEAHYCTFSYHKDFGPYPESVWMGFDTSLGLRGAWFDNCVFLANGSQYNYHDSYIVTPVSSDQFSILYTSAGTQGRLFTMDFCEFRAKNLPSGTPTGNVFAIRLSGLGTGQSIELNNVTIDGAFTDQPFQAGGVTVRWHKTTHERTGSSTIWSGAGATVAF